MSFVQEMRDRAARFKADLQRVRIYETPGEQGEFKIKFPGDKAEEKLAFARKLGPLMEAPALSAHAGDFAHISKRQCDALLRYAEGQGIKLWIQSAEALAEPKDKAFFGRGGHSAQGSRRGGAGSGNGGASRQ